MRRSNFYMLRVCLRLFWLWRQYDLRHLRLGQLISVATAPPAQASFGVFYVKDEELLDKIRDIR